MRLFDSHAHLLDERFCEDRQALVACLQNEGVVGVIECATNNEDIERAVAFARQNSIVYAALGIHPHDAGEYGPDTEALIAALSKERKVVAVGEIGLDYHYDFCERKTQKRVLASQIALAQTLGLPVILHSRESTADMLDVLRACDCTNGVLHCFSGSVETARELLDRGLYLGVGGTLTFKNAVKAVEVVKMAPMDRILLETDSPYLAPVPLRGKRNDPRNVALVAQRIAQIKEMTAEQVSEAALANARRLFQIGEMA